MTSKIFDAIRRHPIASGILFALLLALVLGIPTALIPNPFYHRMLPLTGLDYFFWIATSALIAANIVVFVCRQTQKQSKLAWGGGIVGFFSFACPICNLVLMSIFGSTVLLTVLEPLRPWLGMLSIGMLSVSLYFQQDNKKCKSCENGVGAN